MTEQQKTNIIIGIEYLVDILKRDKEKVVREYNPSFDVILPVVLFNVLINFEQPLTEIKIKGIVERLLDQFPLEEYEKSIGDRNYPDINAVGMFLVNYSNHCFNQLNQALP